MASAYEKERLRFKKEHMELIEENKRLQEVEKDYKLLKIKFDAVLRENEMLKESISKMSELCSISKEDLDLIRSNVNIVKVLKNFSGLGGLFNL